jgi:hypothetical protein
MRGRILSDFARAVPWNYLIKTAAPVHYECTAAVHNGVFRTGNMQRYQLLLGRPVLSINRGPTPPSAVRGYDQNAARTAFPLRQKRKRQVDVNVNVK